MYLKQRQKTNIFQTSKTLDSHNFNHELKKRKKNFNHELKKVTEKLLRVASQLNYFKLNMSTTFRYHCLQLLLRVCLEVIQFKIAIIFPLLPTWNSYVDHYLLRLFAIVYHDNLFLNKIASLSKTNVTNGYRKTFSNNDL